MVQSEAEEAAADQVAEPEPASEAAAAAASSVEPEI